MTTKAFQLRGMIAGDIRMAMWQDPANAGLPNSVLRAKFEAAVKEATKGLPGLPHAYLQKVAASHRAARQKRRREMNLVPYGSSQRQRRRLVAARVRWQIENG